MNIASLYHPARVLVCVCAVILGGSSSAAVSGQTQELPSTGTIRGVVLRGATSEGLGKARVELMQASVGVLSDFEFNPAMLEFAKTRSGFLSTNTNDRGEFAFQNVPQGQYRIEVRRDGFGLSTSPPLDVSAGAQPLDVRIPMTPAAAIAGAVRDEKDRPVVHATVSALESSYRPGGGQLLHVVEKVLTNDLGEYRLYWLSPGDYYVAVDYGENSISDSRGPRQNITRPAKDYPLFYYPGTPEIGNAKPIRIRESGVDATGVDLKLQRVPTVTIRGSVMTEGISVRPLPPIALMLTPASFPDATPGFRIRPDSSGKFEIKDVAPGTYLLKAWGLSATPNGPTVQSPTMRIEVGGKDLEAIAVPTIIAPVVSGRIRVNGESARLPFDPAAVVVRFLGSVGQGNGLYAGDFFNAMISPDGTYSSAALQGAAPGDFDITFLGLPSGYYLKEPLTLQIPNSNVPSSIALDLVVARHRGVTSGSVAGADSRASAGATIVFIPEEKFQRRVDRYPRATSDAEGKFRILSPPPGDYTVYAFENITGDAQYNPEFLQRYLGRGARISIVENGDASVSLRLIPREAR